MRFRLWFLLSISALTAWLLFFSETFSSSAPSVRQLSVLNENVRPAPTTGQFVRPVVAPVTLFAVGDIMLDRNVESVMRQAGDAYPFAKLSSVWQGHDIVFANLEGPIVEQHQQIPSGSLRFSFPKKTAALLRQQGITSVSVANNHSYDHGAAGLQTTRQALDAAGIDAIGDALTYTDATVVTKEVRGQRLILLAFSSAVNPQFNQAAAVSLVKKYAADPRAFVVVSLHWGIEYQPVASQQQQAIAHALIDAGADLILGTHPHVVQNIESYKGKLIFYSLGNFIFDQYFSVETQQELAIDVALSAAGVQVKLYPVQSVHSQPRLMDESLATGWLAALAKRSDPALAEQIRQGMITVP